MRDLSWTHYLPILTTILSLPFALRVYRRYRRRGGGTHLVWWSAGILVYGLGTFAESWITLFGWNPFIFKFWYVVGALLGGAPLAQGTVWLLMSERTARRLSIGLVAVVGVAAACVVASPINAAVVDPHLPSGQAFAWQWVRMFSPFINTYAVIFLVGGAFWSAWRFWQAARDGALVARDRFIGNILIAVGAILPGIGGGASRMGHTEVLYSMELLGILLIWAGYNFNVRRRPARGTSRALSAAALAGALLAPSVVAAQADGGPRSIAGPVQATGELVVTLTGPDQGPLVRRPAALRDHDGGVLIVTTDDEGTARFERLAPGDYTLSVSLHGFVDFERLVTVRGGARELQSVTLTLAPVHYEVTVAATRTPRDLLDAPAEVVVIGRDDLERVQARSLDDVFRYQPSVEMSESPRRLGQTPNIRGFDDQRVLTIRDGARVAGFNSGHRGTLFFDVDDIETIEVLKGPASALYGSGAIGGVVSITTRMPGDLLADDQRIGGSVTTGFSSAYSEWSLTPRLFGQGRSGRGWMMSYTRRRNDGTVRLAGSPGTLEQAEENVDALAGKVVAPVGRGLIRAALDVYSLAGRTSSNLALVQVGPRELVDRETRNLTANLRYTRRGGRWWDQDLSATAYWDETRIDETRPLDDRSDEIRYRTLGLDLRNRTIVGGHAMTYGFEVVRERQRAVRNQAQHAFFPDGRRLMTGIYLQDEFELLDGRLSLVPGLRYDRWDSRPDNAALAEQVVGRLSPRIAGTYELRSDLVAVASYGQGFRAPYFQELFLTDLHFAFPLPGGRFFLALFVPNEALRPERSRNIDLGLRFRRGAMSLRTAWWRAEVDDFIELLPVSTTPFPPPGGLQTQLWRAVNRSRAVLDGIEASLDWSPNAAWSVRAAASRVRGEDQTTGEALLQIPSDKVVLGVGWRSAAAGLALDASTRIHAARDRLPPGVEPTDGYVLHDVHASWTPRRLARFTFRLSIDNLADARHENPRFGTPGIGRDVRVGISYRY